MKPGKAAAAALVFALVFGTSVTSTAAVTDAQKEMEYLNSGIPGQVMNAVQNALGVFSVTATDCGTTSPAAVMTPIKVDPDEAKSGESVTVGAAVENEGSCTVDVEGSVWADLDADGDWESGEEVCQSVQTLSPGESTIACTTTVSMPEGDMTVKALADTGVYYAIDDSASRTVDYIEPDTTDPNVDVDIGPSVVQPGESFTATVVATDNRELDSIQVSGDYSDRKDCTGKTTCSILIEATASSTGEWSITGSATDAAGNTDTDSSSVTVGEPSVRITVTFKRMVLNIANDMFNILK